MYIDGLKAFKWDEQKKTKTAHNKATKHDDLYSMSTIFILLPDQHFDDSIELILHSAHIQRPHDVCFFSRKKKK